MLGAESAGLETLDACEHRVSFLLYFMSSAPWTGLGILGVLHKRSLTDLGMAPGALSTWMGTNAI